MITWIKKFMYMIKFDIFNILNKIMKMEYVPIIILKSLSRINSELDGCFQPVQSRQLIFSDIYKI